MESKELGLKFEEEEGLVSPMANQPDTGCSNGCASSACCCSGKD